MGVTLDTFSSLDEALDFSLGEAGFFDIAQKDHDLWLVMKIIHDLRVGGRRQTVQNIGGQPPTP